MSINVQRPSDPSGPASPLVPRLAEPELRARVAGYLGTAAEVADGWRTDGRWVWPSSLAAEVLTRGTGPGPAFLEYLEATGLAPTTAVAGSVLELAAAVVRDHPSLDSRPARRRVDEDGAFFAVRRASGALAHVGHPHGGILTVLRPRGAVAMAVPNTPSLVKDAVGATSESITAGEAAALLDEWTARRHGDLVRDGLESAVVAGGLARSPVFTGESAAGIAWLGPHRLRITDPARRVRVADYLAGGQLVLRAAGRAPDPLTGDPRPAVPLSFRTDGTWVWQDATEYYLRTLGLAPELGLLCHIEERGAALPPAVGEQVARRAAEVAMRPGQVPLTEPHAYYRAPGALLRWRAGDGVEVLDTDCRWRPTGTDWAGPGPDLTEITVDEAVHVLDDRARAVSG